MMPQRLTPWAATITGTTHVHKVVVRPSPLDMDSLYNEQAVSVG